MAFYQHRFETILHATRACAESRPWWSEMHAARRDSPPMSWFDITDGVPATNILAIGHSTEAQLATKATTCPATLSFALQEAGS